MDLEGASGQVRISLENGASAEERRFAKTTQAIEPPPPEPAEAAPGSGDNGARAIDATTPPPAPFKGSQADAGPGEGAAVRPAAKHAGHRRG